MALVKWEPFLPQWWRMPWFDDESPAEYSEGLNVYETDNDLVVEAYVPGVKESEIDVSLEENVIRIKAEHKEEEKKKKVVYRQTSQASYFYSTTIPCPVKVNQAEAVLENGVLKVVLPKAEEAKPKKIAVKAKAK